MSVQRKDRLHLCRRRYPHTGTRYHGPPSSGRKGAERCIHCEYSFLSIQRTHLMSPQRDECILVVVRFRSPLQVHPCGGQIQVPIASDFEDGLIHLLWRNRPPHSPLPLCPCPCPPLCQNRCPHSHAHLAGSVPLSKKASPEVSYKCTWFGRKIPISVQDEEKAIKAAPRPTMLFAPAYKLQWAGLAVGLCPSPILFSLLTHNSLHGKHRQDSVAGMEA